MPTTETPFLRYWRALDAALERKGGEAYSTGREVEAAYKRTTSPACGAALVAQWRRSARIRRRLGDSGLHSPHTRNAGKDLQS